MKILQSLLLVLSLTLLWPVPSRAQEPVWPASWQGIWDFDHSKRVCDGGAILEHWSERDTVCAGAAILDVGGDCSGGAISDTSLHVVCTEQMAYYDCFWTVETEWYATKTGDAIHGTVQTTTSYSELCGSLVECRLDEFWGDLESTDSEFCLAVPSAEESWGTIKARYE